MEKLRLLGIGPGPQDCFGFSCGAGIAPECRQPFSAGNPENIGREATLVAKVEKLVNAVEVRAVDANTAIVIETVALDNVGDGLELAVMRLVQHAQLVIQIGQIGLRPLDLEPRALLLTSQADRALAQAVAQCERYELR